MIRRPTIFIVLIGIVFAAVGFYFNSSRLAPSPAEEDAVNALFSQKLNDVAEGPVAFSKWKGRILVVNFWATWCPPCVEEMPELSALQEKLGAKNMQIVGIGIDSAANIKEFANKLSIGYPLYIAGMEGTSLARTFGNKSGGLPFTVLIDSTGKISKTYTGRLNMENLEKDVLAITGG